jgi:hypothetical protein
LPSQLLGSITRGNHHRQENAVEDAELRACDRKTPDEYMKRARDYGSEEGGDEWQPRTQKLRYLLARLVL